jgi:predicted CxxxxCH...CXXCH cytochrome family protein
MRKWIIAVATLLCTFPVLSHAASWSLNTWVKTSGGNIVVRNGSPQTSANGSVFKSYTTSKTFNVTVNANTGYNISNVTYNGVSQTLPIANPSSYAVSGPNAQSVYVTFAAQQLSVTASAGAGGSATPASVSGIYYGTRLYSPLRFTFTPVSGFNVVSIAGVPAGATVSPAVPAAANTAVVVTFPTNYTFTGSVALAGTFAGPPVANAGLPQTVLPNTQVTLDGSGSTGVISTYTWVQTSGPASVALAPSGSNATFTASVLGIYTFKLTVTAGSFATTTVNVTNDPAAAAKSQCQNCHQGNNIGIAQNVFGNWSSSQHRANLVMCANCHVGANNGGHPGTLTSGSVSETTFNYNAQYGAGNFCVTCHNPNIITDFAASRHYVRAGAASCSFCHVGGVHNPNAACVDCHTPGNSFGLPWPPTGFTFHNAYTGTNLCKKCHNPHSTVASGCGGCHDCPPQTGSHLKHFGGSIAQAGYGNTEIAKDLTSNSPVYLMNCGNCHPMDAANHLNGVVDIELYNPLAPAGSLKALNPASASYVAGGTVLTDDKGISYTNGTCSNVYCHSYNDWTTTADIPDSDPNWQSKVVATRNYRTITWGGAPLTCNGCHANPPQTSYPANNGGAGDSHSWIDQDGYQNLHTSNMYSAPVSCSYCHNDTVKQLNTYTEDNMGVRILSEVPISNFSKHVNGINDVAFDTQNPFVYSTYGSDVSMSLANATYDPATNNCSNVSCHIKQTTVKWGTPYRWWYNECNVCHGY